MATGCDPVEVDNFTIGRHGYSVIVSPMLYHVFQLLDLSVASMVLL